MQRFMHYVEKTRRADEERDKEVERLVNQNVEEQWKKKDARKRLEKEARKALMQNVLQTRELQRKERGILIENILLHVQSYTVYYSVNSKRSQIQGPM